MIEIVALKGANFRKGTQMKIKMLATVAAAAFLALAANGQTGASRTAGTSGGTGSSTTGGSTTIRPGVNSGAINSSAASPAQPGTVAPANPQTPVMINPNGNTPVVGASLGSNNLGMATNNLGLGTNKPGIGQNQFTVRSNNGVAPLTPTGTNRNVILLNP
jgi:ABC-type phosphate transport system substrate-binding protein